MRLPLSMYVVETKTRSGAPVLFNTVTRQHLPIDASNDQLAENHFLEGSEHDAIWKFLLRPEQKALFTVINTWECNLRCTHCTVSDKLLKHDPIEFDAVAIGNFFKRFQDYYKLPRMLLAFLGGEPLLRPRAILDLMNQTSDRGIMYTITTNLTTKFDDVIWEIMKRLDFIGISIDGTEAAHNEQRRPLTLTTDPFHTTIGNLKELIKAGFGDKLNIQAAISDKHLTEQHRRDFYRMLLKLGVPFERINFACLHPTIKNPKPMFGFNNALKSTQLNRQVCCKYRYYNLTIDRDGSVFADYYTWERVGVISDSMDKFDAAAKRIMAMMPALRDPKCKSCPAIGYCWGGCTNCEVVVGDSPSNYCDQAGLIKSINDHAQRGELI